MYNPFSLEGKTILVTGASSGIGRATAIECSRMGAKVIITARNEERLKETLEQLEGDDHCMILCNLADTLAIDGLVSNLPEIHGLVNNAGFTKLSLLLFQKLLKKKKIKKGASIVFTSSMAGLGCTSVGNSMYTASKGAISAYIKTAALELAPKSIRINAICPAMVNTGILEGGSVTKEQLKEDMKQYPLGRYGDPYDIAWAMIYLLSDASSWITGTNLILDGGLTLK